MEFKISKSNIVQIKVTTDLEFDILYYFLSLLTRAYNMPWYDDEDTFDQEALYKPVLQAGPCTDFREKDPYMCTLDIRVPYERVQELKSLYSPLLQWIDPAFQLIQIEQQQKGAVVLSHKQDHLTNIEDKYTSDNLITQSLSVVLFLREETKYQLNARFAKDYLETPPWLFHHKIELASRSDMRSVARQDYYESFPDLPLWTVCSVHYGNEQLRFNIFVKDFKEMKKFYRVLTGTEPSACKPGFCTFDLYSQPGLDIKLSLKYSPSLQPYPPKQSVLKFSVPYILDIKERLNLILTSYGNDTWLTRDPDGNDIVLSSRESEWCDECLGEEHFTEVSDSGQWSETPSEDSSWEMCSITDSEDFSCESGCDSLSDCGWISV